MSKALRSPDRRQPLITLTTDFGLDDVYVGVMKGVIAGSARGSIFLAPDNGLLGFVAPPEEMDEVVSVEEARHFLPRVSRTFHGRDIFAPVAARLALGLPLRRLGPAPGPMVPGGLPPVRKTPIRGG